ncbi:7-cyano-7-deazaguanine synthase [Camelimonas fluminis]|uniref:7-cyano-7-deazaguanine synthase n=1 Tax=Camelimonas fluminis TaxID=1576911 RepID=A0ABV7UFS1_9HYPH|nr:7-cyano-7-deazaguanine synthase QueC [Camelimonas fluminis]GHE70383.1 7-cyano-7-deazaguanine synthase [Camelimonas fluminis]
MLNNDRALVLLSGGQDSSTCLAWALARFAEVETIGFDYGQRHAVELDCRDAIRAGMAAPSGALTGRLGDDHMLKLEALGAISDTAMTRDIAIVASENGLPNTFVPGRNLLFVTFAAAVAYRRGCRHIVLGVCETDYSGYPDCRDDAIKAMQVALNIGMEARFVLHTPLMWRDKAATFALAEDLGGAPLLDLIVEHSHTCYVGDRSRRHAWGYGCGECPACQLRADGWRRFMSARNA